MEFLILSKPSFNPLSFLKNRKVSEVEIGWVLLIKRVFNELGHSRINSHIVGNKINGALASKDSEFDSRDETKPIAQWEPTVKLKKKKSKRGKNRVPIGVGSVFRHERDRWTLSKWKVRWREMDVYSEREREKDR